MKLLKNVLVLILTVLFVYSCTDEDSAKRILEANGYTEIRFTGYDFFGGSKGDFYKTGFIAKSPNGTIIEGTVCEGLFFKNSTIRFK